MAAARRLLSLLLALAWARPAGCTDPPDGGWLAGTVPEEERCTVERADASLSYSVFLQRFAFSRPVILRGVTDNSAFRALCTREKLLAAFGARPVRLSTANTYSYRKVAVPFREYVEQLLKPQDPARLGSDTLYFFGDNNFTEWGPLFQRYVPPAFRIPGTSPAYSFGIAGPVLPRPLVARHAQPGHQRLHLHLPGVEAGRLRTRRHHPGRGGSVPGRQLRLLPPPGKGSASGRPLNYWCRDRVPEEALVFTGLFPPPWIKVVVPP
ncbi:jmjC domain-containing protein 8 isoform X8 [Ciconia boyciana]|uniref:jmjC domain-containing protein 8 isoform X8 n=1 Tax=Ciconia boyciana TaxID=52775 RepID=UPI003B9E9A73